MSGGPYTGTPIPWTTGASISDTKTADWLAVLLAITGPWTAWTPAITGSTTDPNVSSATGGYIQVGHLVGFHASITLSSNGTGTYSVSLPVISNEPTGSPIGVATLFDASGSANRYFRSAWQNANTSVALGAEDSTRVGNAVPFTFASGDIIAVKGWYEAA